MNTIRNLIAVAFFCFAGLHSTGAADANFNSVTLAWNANTETDLAGYRLFFSKDPAAWTHVKPLGLVTTATIELPASIPSPDANDEQDSDEADERAREKEMVVGGAVDADAEALREQKRLKRHRRKEYHKQVSTEKDVKLTLLERQNQQLLERLSVLERKSHGSDLARLDKAIEDQDARILFAKQKISEATRTGNGELLTSAQEMWFEARRQAEALANLKKRAVAPQAQRTIQAPDPQLQRHASNWMANNPWYDPNGKDPDSRRALNEDAILAEEGTTQKLRSIGQNLTSACKE